MTELMNSSTFSYLNIACPQKRLEQSLIWSSKKNNDNLQGEWK